ncbi:MAG: glycosyltransferase family 2 protein [Phycisphaerales bacterium]
MQLPVTVVIPVRNEERNLPACLERLGAFERVVVVDSGSTDRTPEIVRKHGAELVNFAWDGRFPKKRNWYLRQNAIRTPWVFFLDADEFVDQAFCDELATTLPSTQHVGFWLTYSNWFLGRKLNHGEPNRKLALFRVGAGEYERIEEDTWSHLDMEVHEHPVLAGTTGEIRARLDHRDYRGLEHWIRKHNDYSTWEARRLARLRAQKRLNDPTLTPRQRRKYGSIGSWWLPAAYFTDVYVRRRGFLDGHAGFVFAFMKAVYFWEIGLKAREFAAEDAG